jgi:hypothetical protein
MDHSIHCITNTSRSEPHLFIRASKVESTSPCLRVVAHECDYRSTENNIKKHNYEKHVTRTFACSGKSMFTVSGLQNRFGDTLVCILTQKLFSRTLLLNKIPKLHDIHFM